MSDAELTVFNLKGQLQRLDARIGIMAKLMAHDRTVLEADIKEWRERLADCRGKLLHAEQTIARQAKRIDELERQLRER